MACECNRRQMVRSLLLGSGLFSAVLKDLLAAEASPLAPKAPHFPGTAKRVIFIYLSGGMSHVDSFDPKPKLGEYQRDGKTAENGRKVMGSPWEAWPRGESGIEITDLFPNLAECADDLCVIRTMRGDHNDHFQATLGIHTGSVTFKRPSVGSWVTYGLGTENQNLPCYVVLAPEMPYCGSQVWSSDFLPGVYSGTRIVSGPEPVPDLNRRAPSAEMQKLELSLLDRFNRKHERAHPGDPMLDARIKSYETAFGMQMTMPKVLDLSKESDATLQLYGMERGATAGFGWQCLVARRMIEQGVRFVELIDVGSSNNWDAHGDIHTHGPLAKKIDKPVAGLLADLKGRGLLKDTLVVFTTEFGRSPGPEGTMGRGHYNRAFSSWLAGGGVKGGVAYGKTDDFGFRILENECHVHDFHATILHCLGFDHTKLTFRHAGRDYRLTDVAGRVVKEILA
ncbi:MAG TPA: DUF1501 domain-containing protein [Candidatus Acidoferrales bacterium]|nr:DUF1501 domain-containing protein [Candidatus Acidoferrales bacterium]